MASVTFKVPTISCQHCVNTIELELKELPGVVDVKANPEMKTTEVVYEEPATEEILRNLLAEINYPAE
ncbi:MAG: heavy-metal-associated domain-containing protein [Anaerolineales bacterium]